MGRLVFRALVSNIFALAAASVLFIIGMAIWAGHASWVRGRENAEFATSNLVSVVERQLGESLAKVEASTLTIVAEVQHEKREHGKFNSALLSEFLAVQKTLVPEIGYFGMTNSRGIIQMGDGAPNNGAISVADRDYFIQLRDNPEIKSVMYGPISGKVSKQWVVGFAARITDARGNFDGVVFSAIPVEVIQRHLESLNLGKSGAATVRTGTFALVARVTAQRADPDSAIGSTKVSYQFQTAIAANPQKGRYIANTALDTIERINSYSKIGSYPMYAILGLATEDLVAGQRNELFVIIVFAALASGIAVTSACLLNRSIRQQETAAETVRNSEARYARVVDGADEGIWEWNLKTQEIVVSQRFQTMLGYAPGEWIPSFENWKSRLHPEDVASTMELFNQHLAGTSSTYIAEFRMQTKVGDWKWIQSRGRVIMRDASGAPELISGTHTDISTRKELEVKLNLLTQDFISFLEHTGDFIYFKDKDSRFRFCSQTLATITGHSDWRELIGKHDLEVFPPETAHIYYEEELPIFRDGTPLLNKIDPYVDQNSNSGWVSTNKWPLRDSSGNVNGLFGVSRIVTEQIRLQRDHAKLLAEQQAILDNELVAIMATEGRTIKWVNPAFEELFGYEHGALIGQSTRLGYCNDYDFETFGAGAYPVLERGASFRTECQFQRKDGSRFMAEVSGKRLAVESGQSLWCFLDITERKLSEDKIRQLAFYDPLTQLPNRRLFGDRLTQAMAQSERSNAYGALLVVDLDNFKPLNDTHGHVAGDLLLQQSAQRISRCVRETDTVGRFGGDEFVVVLGPLVSQHVESAALAQTIAEKIRLAIGEPYEIALNSDHGNVDKVTHSCTASIGVVMFLGNKDSAEELFKVADAAMYEAKETGRNMVRLACRVVR